MKRRFARMLIVVALVQAALVPSGVVAQSPGALEPATLPVPASGIGSGWSATDSSVSASQVHAGYTGPGKVTLSVDISVLGSGDAAAGWMAQVRTDFAMSGNDLSDVAGLGDVAYGRTRTSAGSARAAYVFSVGGFGAVVQATGAGDVQSVALQYAHLQEARFRAALAASVSVGPTPPAAIQTPAAAAPGPDVQAMVLPAEALGPEWSLVDRGSKQDSETVKYFNNAADRARFRAATVLLDVYPDERQAELATDAVRSEFEGFRYELAPTNDVGPGRAYRGVQSGERGLQGVARVFQVGKVTVAVTLNGFSDQRVQDIDADDLSLAMLHRARIQAVLAGEPVGAVAPPPTWPSIPDPTGMVLPVDYIGGAWTLDGDSDQGSATELFRTHSRLYRAESDEGPTLSGGIAVTLARGEPTARMTLGLLVAELQGLGYTVGPVDSLGEGLSCPAFVATHAWDSDIGEARYLYQCGRAVAQVSITAPGAQPDDLLTYVGDWSRWQAFRILSILPTLSNSPAAALLI
jgi:hypothetical protein